jgi:NAD(P)-dependent dehydrogenase (short-subunit alcohol dehydrogenase family)
MMKTILITGCNRGIGFCLTQKLLKDENNVVIGTTRSDTNELTDLKAVHHDRLHIIQMDVGIEKSVKEAFTQISNICTSLDVIINNAGYAPDKMKKAEHVPRSDMIDAFETNTLGPLTIIQQSLSLLRKGEMKKIINISSLLGSHGMNPGRQIAYSTSKCALGMITSVFAKELANEGFTVVAVHPGTVATDMRPDLKLPGTMPHIQPEESAEGILNNIVFSKEQLNGRFITWNGENMPW